MLLAKDVAPIETDFINVLEHTPGTKAEKQAYFQSKSIRVPRTNYEAMWSVLTERLHHSGAAQSVFECLQAHMPDRLRELLRIAARGKTRSGTLARFSAKRPARPSPVVAASTSKGADISPADLANEPHSAESTESLPAHDDSRSTGGHPCGAWVAWGARARFSSTALRSATDWLAPSILQRRC